ncbi:hypothetical protein ACFY1U_23000 [Streptomyces sp. NPDC001351]|uniref:hypothetical protein n=1 Tax=Streptomyces sp. NPDC001351 TaxID=3364564 RepID=UPI0036CD9A36
MRSFKNPSRIFAAASATGAATLLAIAMAAAPASAATTSRIAINGNLISPDAASVAVTDPTNGTDACFAASRGTTLIATAVSVNSGDNVHFDMYRKPGCGDWNSAASFSRVVPDDVSQTWNVN